FHDVLCLEQRERNGYKNENWYVTTDSDKKILFTGLDDSMLGNVYMPDSTKIYDSNYNILLIHEPDTADSFQEYPYDLVLSGHSHGGQVNIPFIPAINQKAISSTNLAKNYVSGMYELNSKTKIYVNTGIGTTHVSGRLGVVPEISIFHIYL
ncbi:metallophosphoesterase, partial [Blautia sp. DFI.4.84]|nr:metallophosphoesterase [Blautia sp. DFI.4.84]